MLTMMDVKVGTKMFYNNNCTRRTIVLPSSRNRFKEVLTESAGGALIRGNVLGSTPIAISDRIVGASGHL